MAAKIRKGDKVIVLTGRDKGRTGEVIEVQTDAGRAGPLGGRPLGSADRPGVMVPPMHRRRELVAD